MTKESIDNLLERINRLHDIEHYNEAINSLTRYLAEVKDARLFFARGVLLEAIDKPESAIADYTSAIELDTSNPVYYYNRGSVLSHTLQNDQAAIRDFEATLILNPNSAEAHRECCLSLLVLGRNESAWEHAQAALALSPDQASTQFCAGQAQLSLDRIDDALESFLRAVELDNQSAHYWSALGRVQEQLGGSANEESAINAYSMAIQIDSSSALYFYSRGKLNMKLGRMQQAKSDFAHALSLPSDEGTSILIEHFQQALKNE